MDPGGPDPHDYCPPGVIKSLLAQTVKRLPAMWETWVRFLSQKDPLEKEMAIRSSTLAWKIHGRKSLIGYSPWGLKESDTIERLHSLTHSIDTKVSMNSYSFPFEVM